MNVIIISNDVYFALGIKKLFELKVASDPALQAKYIIRRPIFEQHEEVILCPDSMDVFSSQDLAFSLDYHVSIFIGYYDSCRSINRVKKDFRVDKSFDLPRVKNIVESAIASIKVKIKSNKERLSVFLKNVSKLQTKETTLLGYFGKGLSPKGISLVMKIDLKRVSFYKRAIMRKLNIKNNVEFFRFAISINNSKYHP